MSGHSKRTISALAVLFGIATLLLSAMAAPAKKSAIWNLYERADQFGNMSHLVYKSKVDAHWNGGTHSFWYRNDVRGESEFILVDADMGTRGPAFDHVKLAEAINAATGAKVTKSSLPFTSIDFIDKGHTLVFKFGSQWWSCNLLTYELSKREGGIPGPVGTPPAYSPKPDQSPDGKLKAFIKNNNLYIQPTDGGPEKQLSTDGTDKVPYTLFFWSPDSKRIAVWKTELGDNLPVYTVESSPKNGLRPVLHQVTYDLPGDKLNLHSLSVFTIDGKQTSVKMDPLTYGDAPEARWWADNRTLTFERIDRAYKWWGIVKVDSETGESKPIAFDACRTFVYPPCQTSKYLDATKELIWPSERDGWCHLYLFDMDTCTLKNQITKGEWVVRSIESVDEKARQIIFTACGREANENPYLIHYYRVNFDGTGLICLTPGNGQHDIEFSPDKAFYIDRYSRVDMAPITVLRKTSDASLVCALEKADVKDLLKAGYKFPEPFVAKGRDGKTDIYGVIFRPSKLNPRKKYPIIEDIYAGPQDSFVPLSFSARRGNQGLAELGFIVVQIDGMGTANRSKAFHEVCYKNLGDSGFPDRIAWMKAAAENYPYMDLTRVGVCGMSAGGYNSAHALLAHPEFYKVAVSMSGNHDHRTDKVWWNELWMGYPIGPHYAAQSNMTMAKNLVGKLLLIHGEMDDNVNVSAGTLQLVNALIEANRDFDMLIIPGMNHAIIPWEYRKLKDYFVKNLLGIEPPANFEPTGGEGSSCTISIQNMQDVPVDITIIGPDNKPTKLNTLAPGEKITRKAKVGDEYEATANGASIAKYTVSLRGLRWAVTKDSKSVR